MQLAERFPRRLASSLRMSAYSRARLSKMQRQFAGSTAPAARPRAGGLNFGAHVRRVDKAVIVRVDQERQAFSSRFRR
jgi:hypothetical protein